MALDPDHRLVVSVVPGKRAAENTLALVRDFRRRTSGRLVGVNRETVARYGRKAGAHAAGLHDELVAVSPSDP